MNIQDDFEFSQSFSFDSPSFDPDRNVSPWRDTTTEKSRPWRPVEAFEDLILGEEDWSAKDASSQTQSETTDSSTSSSDTTADASVVVVTNKKVMEKGVGASVNSLTSFGSNFSGATSMMDSVDNSEECDSASVPRFLSPKKVGVWRDHAPRLESRSNSSMSCHKGLPPLWKRSIRSGDISGDRSQGSAFHHPTSNIQARETNRTWSDGRPMTSPDFYQSANSTTEFRANESDIFPMTSSEHTSQEALSTGKPILSNEYASMETSSECRTVSSDNAWSKTFSGSRPMRLRAACGSQGPSPRTRPMSFPSYSSQETLSDVNPVTSLPDASSAGTSTSTEPSPLSSKSEERLPEQPNVLSSEAVSRLPSELPLQAISSAGGKAQSIIRSQSPRTLNLFGTKKVLKGEKEEGIASRPFSSRSESAFDRRKRQATSGKKQSIPAAASQRLRRVRSDKSGDSTNPDKMNERGASTKNPLRTAQSADGMLVKKSNQPLPVSNRNSILTRIRSRRRLNYIVANEGVTPYTRARPASEKVAPENQAHSPPVIFRFDPEIQSESDATPRSHEKHINSAKPQTSASRVSPPIKKPTDNTEENVVPPPMKKNSTVEKDRLQVIEKPSPGANSYGRACLSPKTINDQNLISVKKHGPQTPPTKGGNILSLFTETKNRENPSTKDECGCENKAQPSGSITSLLASRATHVKRKPSITMESPLSNNSIGMACFNQGTEGNLLHPWTLGSTTNEKLSALRNSKTQTTESPASTPTVEMASGSESLVSTSKSNRSFRFGEAQRSSKENETEKLIASGRNARRQSSKILEPEVAAGSISRATKRPIEELMTSDTTEENEIVFSSVEESGYDGDLWNDPTLWEGSPSSASTPKLPKVGCRYYDQTIDRESKSQAIEAVRSTDPPMNRDETLVSEPNSRPQKGDLDDQSVLQGEQTSRQQNGMASPNQQPSQKRDKKDHSQNLCHGKDRKIFDFLHRDQNSKRDKRGLPPKHKSNLHRGRNETKKQEGPLPLLSVRSDHTQEEIEVVRDDISESDQDGVTEKNRNSDNANSVIFSSDSCAATAAAKKLGTSVEMFSHVAKPNSGFAQEKSGHVANKESPITEYGRLSQEIHDSSLRECGISSESKSDRMMVQGPKSMLQAGGNVAGEQTPRRVQSSSAVLYDSEGNEVRRHQRCPSNATCSSTPSQNNGTIFQKDRTRTSSSSRCQSRSSKQGQGFQKLPIIEETSEDDTSIDKKEKTAPSVSEKEDNGESEVWAHHRETSKSIRDTNEDKKKQKASTWLLHSRLRAFKAKPKNSPRQGIDATPRSKDRESTLSHRKLTAQPPVKEGVNEEGGFELGASPRPIMITGTDAVHDLVQFVEAGKIQTSRERECKEEAEQTPQLVARRGCMGDRFSLEKASVSVNGNKRQTADPKAAPLILYPVLDYNPCRPALCRHHCSASEIKELEQNSHPVKDIPGASSNHDPGLLVRADENKSDGVKASTTTDLTPNISSGETPAAESGPGRIGTKNARRKISRALKKWNKPQDRVRERDSNCSNLLARCKASRERTVQKPDATTQKKDSRETDAKEQKQPKWELRRKNSKADIRGRFWRGNRSAREGESAQCKNQTNERSDTGSASTARQNALARENITSNSQRQSSSTTESDDAVAPQSYHQGAQIILPDNGSTGKRNLANSTSRLGESLSKCVTLRNREHANRPKTKPAITVDVTPIPKVLPKSARKVRFRGISEEKDDDDVDKADNVTPPCSGPWSCTPENSARRTLISKKKVRSDIKSSLKKNDAQEGGNRKESHENESKISQEDKIHKVEGKLARRLAMDLKILSAIERRKRKLHIEDGYGKEQVILKAVDELVRKRTHHQEKSLVAAVRDDGTQKPGTCFAQARDDFLALFMCSADPFPH